MPRSILLQHKTLTYALYDWANSAFATTVMAGFFPVFFKQFWSAGTDATVSTARLGFANAGAGLLIALLAPLLGAISDRGIQKTRFLLFFTLLGGCSAASLFWVDQGNWVTAAGLYIIGSFAFIGSNLFYDSLLVDVAPPAQRNLVSTFGYACGYLGGGLLFAINVLMTLKPSLFGLSNVSQAVQISFLSVGAWWIFFGLPVQFSHRAVTNRALPPGLIGAAGRQLLQTLSELRSYRQITLFLLAYWLYIDGVHTIIKMAVDYGLSLGFRSSALVSALLLTQFVGFPAALGFGWLANRCGAVRAIKLAILGYLGVTLYGAFMRTEFEFYLMAGAIGLVQGGIQALSRATFANLIPLDRSAEFFGFYNMVGKFAAIAGPALVAVTGLLARQAGLPEMTSTRLGISSVALMFVGGWFLLSYATRPQPTEGREAPCDRT